VVKYLAGLDDMTPHLTTHIPMQILTDIDNGRNPMHLTKDRLERAATENQFMNGKIQAIEVSSGLDVGWCLDEIIELPESVRRGTSTDIPGSRGSVTWCECVAFTTRS
jgi:Transcription factor subunit Med10 of Mediator complex